MLDAAHTQKPHGERSRRPRKRGRRGPKASRRRSSGTLLAVVALGLSGGAVTGGATPSHADAPTPVTTERKLFVPERTNLAGSAVAVASDTVAYTNAYGGEVQIAELAEPETDTWIETTLTPDEYESTYGADVALAPDGLTLYVSAPASERIYVYSREARGTWVEAAPLLAPEPVAPIEDNGIGFGRRILADGNRLLVGVPSGVVDGEQWSGFAYLVELPRDPDEPAQWTPLIAGTPQPWDAMGEALALSGDRVAMGAPGGSTDDPLSYWGGVYQWDLTDADLTPRYRETPPLGSDTCINEESMRGFGSTLAFDDTSLFVGAAMEITLPEGSAPSTGGVCGEAEIEHVGATRGTIYRFDAALQQIGGKILPQPQTSRFGYSIAVAGDRLISSGGSYDGPPSWSGDDTPGEVQVLQRAGLSEVLATVETPHQRPDPAQIMRPSSPEAAGRAFGSQPSTHGFASTADMTFVGAPDNLGPRSLNSGSAYLFDHTPLPEPPKPGPITLATDDVVVSYGAQAELSATVSGTTDPGEVRGTLNQKPIGPVATVAGEALIAVPGTPLDTGVYPFELEFLSEGDDAPSARATGTLTIVPVATTVAFTAVDASGTPVTEADERTPFWLQGTVGTEVDTTPRGTVEIWDSDDEEVLLRLPVTENTGAFALPADDPGFVIVDLDARLEARYTGDGNHLPAVGHVTVAALGPDLIGGPTPRDPPAEDPPAGEAAGPRTLAATGATPIPLGWSTAFVLALLLLGTTLLTHGRRRA